MKVLAHESDEGFQKVAVIMAVLAVLYGILSVEGCMEAINLLRGSYDEWFLAVFILINLIVSFTKGTLRYYAGASLLDRGYLLFLSTGLLAVTFLLSNMLVSIFLF